MKNPTTYPHVHLTGSQMEELLTLIGAEVLKMDAHPPHTLTATKRRMLLKQSEKALTDTLEGTDWRSDGSGQFSDE